MRILAFGVLGKARSTFGVNNNARAFLHPPGVHKDAADAQSVGALSESSSLLQSQNVQSIPSEEVTDPDSKLGPQLHQDLKESDSSLNSFQ